MSVSMTVLSDTPRKANKLLSWSRKKTSRLLMSKWKLMSPTSLLKHSDLNDLKSQESFLKWRISLRVMRAKASNIKPDQHKAWVPGKYERFPEMIKLGKVSLRLAKAWSLTKRSGVTCCSQYCTTYWLSDWLMRFPGVCMVKEGFPCNSIPPRATSTLHISTFLMKVRKNISLWFLPPSIQSTSLAVLAPRAASRHQGRKGAVRKCTSGWSYHILHQSTWIEPWTCREVDAYSLEKGKENSLEFSIGTE